MKTEHEIQNAIRTALAPYAILFRYNCGKLQDKRGQWIDFGPPPGHSDLAGMCLRTGRFIAIECKSAKGKPTDAQLRFLEAIRAGGGIAGVCRTSEEAIKLLKGTNE